MQAVFGSPVYAALFILLLLVAMTCFISGCWIQIKDRKLLDSGNRIVATIISRHREEVKYSSRDSLMDPREYYRYWVEFEVVLNGRQVKKMSAVSAKIYFSLMQGQRVPVVFYDDLEDMRLVEDVRSSGSFKALIVIGFVFLLFAGVIIGMANTPPN